MKDERSKWSAWKAKHYASLSRVISGFGEVEVNAKGMRIELMKDTPRLKRRTIEAMSAKAGECVTTQLPSLSRDVIFVRMK